MVSVCVGEPDSVQQRGCSMCCAMLTYPRSLGGIDQPRAHRSLLLLSILEVSKTPNVVQLTSRERAVIIQITAV